MEEASKVGDVTSPVQDEDALAGASRSLETAEAADDPTRLAALDSLHARLADELDKPAGAPSAE